MQSSLGGVIFWGNGLGLLFPFGSTVGLGVFVVVNGLGGVGGGTLLGGCGEDRRGGAGGGTGRGVATGAVL